MFVCFLFCGLNDWYLDFKEGLSLETYNYVVTCNSIRSSTYIYKGDKNNLGSNNFLGSLVKSNSDKKIATNYATDNNVSQQS